MNFEEALVEQVRLFPCLWKTTDKSYKDLRARENAWKIVAEQTKYSTEQCSTRWKSLRDKFVKELRKVKTRKSGDKGPPYVSPWKLYGAMSFLTEAVKHRQSDSNLELQDVAKQAEPNQASTPSDKNDSTMPSSSKSDVASESTSADPKGTEPAKSATKRPFEAQKSSANKKMKTDDVIDGLLLKTLGQINSESKEDEDELFGRQIAATMRRLTKHQKAVAKLQMQSVLLNIEFPTLHDEQAYGYPYSS